MLTAPPPFRCEVEPARELVRVLPSGELDMSTAGLVDAQLHELREAGFRAIELDLRDVTFVDSTGVHLALRWTRLASEGDFAFGIARGTESVQRVFRMTGLADVLPFGSG